MMRPTSPSSPGESVTSSSSFATSPSMMTSPSKRSRPRRRLRWMKFLPQGAYTLVPTIFTTIAWVSSLFQDGCDYSRVSGPIVYELTGTTSIPYIEVGFSAYRIPTYIPPAVTFDPLIYSTMDGNTIATDSDSSNHTDTNTTTITIDNTTITGTTKESGTWKVDYSGACIQYDYNYIQLDNAWNSAKGFAFLALVMGGGGSLFLWFTGCCVFSRATWRWVGYEIMLASLFQLLSFSWYVTSMCTKTDIHSHYNYMHNKNITMNATTTATNITAMMENDHFPTHNQCALGWGSKANIIGAILWIIAANFIFIKYPYPKSSLSFDSILQPSNDDDLRFNMNIATTGMEYDNDEYTENYHEGHDNYSPQKRITSRIPPTTTPSTTSSKSSQKRQPPINNNNIIEATDIEVV